MTHLIVEEFKDLILEKYLNYFKQALDRVSGLNEVHKELVINNVLLQYEEDKLKRITQDIRNNCKDYDEECGKHYLGE